MEDKLKDSENSHPVHILENRGGRLWWGSHKGHGKGTCDEETGMYRRKPVWVSHGFQHGTVKMRGCVWVTEDCFLSPGVQAKDHNMQWREGALVPCQRTSFTCITYTMNSQNILFHEFSCDQRKAFSELMWSAVKGEWSAFSTCSPES
jgi:hypothetical protein